MKFNLVKCKRTDLQLAISEAVAMGYVDATGEVKPKTGKHICMFLCSNWLKAHESAMRSAYMAGYNQVDFNGIDRS